MNDEKTTVVTAWILAVCAVVMVVLEIIRLLIR
jgi:hypothetical protein